MMFGLVTTTNANTAINYLVITATAAVSAGGVLSELMSVRISTICPNSSGYVYYGSPTSTIFWDNSTPPVTSKSAGICVVGVPSAITLSSAGKLGLPSIILSVGGAEQNLAIYSTVSTFGHAVLTSGLVLPDNSIINVSSGVGGAGTYTIIFKRNVYSMYVVGAMGTLIDQNGAICDYSGYSNTIWDCANYLMGY